jgi:hypothetical protein
VYKLDHEVDVKKLRIDFLVGAEITLLPTGPVPAAWSTHVPTQIGPESSFPGSNAAHLHLVSRSGMRDAIIPPLRYTSFDGA